MADKILKSITFPNLPDKYIIPEITVDAVPTQGSTNAVQSGGVKAAIEDVHSEIPVIDPTLTKSGQAADAAAVGAIARVFLALGLRAGDDGRIIQRLPADG